MDKNCVDNAHKADWIREMNAMEHDCDEVRKDNRFEPDRLAVCTD